MKKSRKILSGIMAMCLMGGMAVIPEGIISKTFAEEYISKGDGTPGIDDDFAPFEEVTEEETTEIVKSGKWGKSGTWSLDADGVLTISGEKTFGGLDDELTSDEIQTVRNLVIEDGITVIASEAFRGYSSLKYVTFPDTLTDIGDRAFHSCKVLCDVEFPNSLKTIGKSTFYDCFGLTDIVIPDSVTTIAEYAFNCSGLKSLTIGRGIISIGSGAFLNTGIGVAYYRGTEKEWKAVEKGASAVPCTVKCLVKSGDANGDGEVSLSDAVFIMQSLSNPDEYQLDENQLLNADVVDAGSGMTTMDALAIQMIGINLISLEDLPMTSEEIANVTQ